MRKITLGEFTVSFVPFALLLPAALLGANLKTDVGFYRTIYTIWVTTILVIPAYCAFTLPGVSPHKFNIWRLFWTFAWIVYIVHVWYAFFYVYHGSFQEMVVGQEGIFNVFITTLFTLWWTFDVLLAWFSKRQDGWVHKQRIAWHWFAFGNFVASTIFLRPGIVTIFGVALVLAVLICLAYRWDWRHHRVATA